MAKKERDAGFDPRPFEGSDEALPMRPAGSHAGGRGANQATTTPHLHPATAAQMRASSHRPGPVKAVGITVGVIVVLLAAVYGGATLYFSDRFFPNTSIGTVDVSFLSSSEAEAAVQKAVDGYELTVDGQGFNLDLTAADGLLLDAGAVVRTALSDETAWKWPLEVIGKHDESAALTDAYDTSGLEETVRSAVDEFNASAEMPVDATIAYSSSEGGFVVQKERIGGALDADSVVGKVNDAVAAFASKASLDSGDLLQPSVFSDDERLTAAQETANGMLQANFPIVMGDDEVAVVNADLLAPWITLDAELAVSFDEEKLATWASELGAECDTVGSTRSYTRPDGKTFTVSGGVYGWETDEEALVAAVKEAVQAGSTEKLEMPTVTHGEVFAGAGKQDWGKRYCDVDLSEQHVRFYDDNGKLVWESDCISGEPDGEHDTSTGVYWVNQKESPSQLTGYQDGKKIYESTVQYWIPFDKNAIGLHDADWQPKFGGTLYKEGYGSHGCVNLPPDKAKELYNIIQEGDVVVSHW